MQVVKEFDVLKNDQLQLISLMHFVVFGTSSVFKKKERSLEEEFNMFYIKTIKHTEEIYEKVHQALTLRKKEEEAVGTIEGPKEAGAAAPETEKPSDEPDID